MFLFYKAYVMCYYINIFTFEEISVEKKHKSFFAKSVTFMIILATVFFALFIQVLVFAFISADDVEGLAAKRAMPEFVEFTKTTTKTYPDEKDRTEKMYKLVEQAEKKVRNFLVIYQCSITLVANNPNTIYRVDRMKIRCVPWFKNKPTKLKLVVEHSHKS